MAILNTDLRIMETGPVTIETVRVSPSFRITCDAGYGLVCGCPRQCSGVAARIAALRVLLRGVLVLPVLVAAAISR